MKKHILSVVVMSAFSLAVTSFSASAATSNTANVTLSGIISAATCGMEVNGVSGGTRVDTGMHVVDDFTGNANTYVGTPVPMTVTVKNCTPAGAATTGSTGWLYVSGNTAANGNNNIFVGSNTSTGFMVLDEADSPVANETPVSLNLPEAATTASYSFTAAMASTTETPTAGLYTAPIVIAYATE
jgi:Protein of unknown function (DUF2574)./Fimbrial protein.